MRPCLHRLTILLMLLIATCSTSLGEIPIIAFIGVPVNHSETYRFREFRECGFDVSISDYGDTPVSTLLSILDSAHHEGVRIMMGSNLFYNSQSRHTISTIKNHPALFGYFLMDEPRPDEMHKAVERFTAVNRWDSIKPRYVNLHPNLGTPVLKYFKLKSYSQYLRAATAIGLPQISFDIYPITNDSVRTTWYPCLEDVRKESLRSGKPFWAFVLSTPHRNYPQPTLASLRLQIYSNLAYGAQAIQYFTYWTPNIPEDNYRNGPIGLDGKPASTYKLVQRMNRELRQVARLFDGAKVVGVHHLGRTIPEGTKRLKVAPANLRRLRIEGRPGAIVSQLEKEGHHYLAIVNKNHKDEMKVHLETKNDTPRHLTKGLKEEPIQNSYTVQPGDILLFKLQ